MQLTKNQIIEYLQGANDAALFYQASQLRQKYFGNEIFLRGIIEFNNHCKANCNYCGLRRSNQCTHRYSLSDQEIHHCIEIIVQNNLGTVVLQSGENTREEINRLTKIIREVKKKYPLAITLSLGEHSFETYQKLKDAGADRYLLRIETFNKAIYQNARPQRNLTDRLRCIEDLKRLNFEIGSGFMVGLPGETIETLADNIIQLTEMDLDMIGIGPFIAHPDTPFKNYPSGDYLLSLRTLALVKILNPLANMPATSAMESARTGGRLNSLKIGMNVLMPTVTPASLKGNYNIYPGKNTYLKCDNEILELKTILQNAGFDYSGARGDSLKYLKKNKAQGVKNV